MTEQELHACIGRAIQLGADPAQRDKLREFVLSVEAKGRFPMDENDHRNVTDPCPTGTINYPDDDVQQVAAALGDACFAGGLSESYYREADDALKRLVAKLERGKAEGREEGFRCGQEQGFADAKEAARLEVSQAVDALGRLIEILRELGCDEDEDPGLWLRNFADRVESGEVDDGQP